MGTFSVAVQVGHIDGGDMERVPEAVVDTGSLHSMFPASMLEYLSVKENMRRFFTLADGNEREYAIGFARIAIDGQSDVPICAVLFGPEDTYLIGATTLETFTLMVDPDSEELVPKRLRARPI